MSEHYDFHYQPTGSGAISGQQVLEQTEDAINELGDYVNDNVGGAMDVAQQALETAQNAEQDAQTALDTANSFSSAIQSAQQDASTALSTAQTAQTTATNANNTAIQAQQDASNAVTTANNASGQVSTLSGTVTALGQRVTTAEGNIGQNTSDISSLTTRVGTAEGNITTLQTDVSIAMGNASSAMATAGTVKQQAYVFRYSSTALVASSTNSNALLDNTDNLKVGDKVIDSSGVLFSITAIDTANSTFTIGSALVDLALDANVVHLAGDETINGVKSFINYFLGKDLSGQTVDLNDCVDAYGGAIHYYYAVSNYANISNKPENKPFILESKTVRYVSSIDYIYYQKIYTAEYNNSPSIYTRYYRSGSASWSNWVKDTDKFVTTNTAQNITATKSFTVTPYIYNADTNASIPNLYLRNQISEKGNIADHNSQFIMFTDKNNKRLTQIQTNKGSSGETSLSLRIENTDNSNNDINSQINYYITKSGGKNFTSNADNEVNLGISGSKWKDINTYLINGLTPSSLGMPSDRSARVDISGYFTNTANGDINTYTAPANGWIYLNLNDVTTVHCYAQISTLTHYGQTFARASAGQLLCLFPVRKDDVLSSQWYTTTTVTVTSAYFVPCQGNV